VTEAARLLGCHRDSVQQWCRQGKLRAYRTPGGRYRIPRASLEAMLTRGRWPDDKRDAFKPSRTTGRRPKAWRFRVTESACFVQRLFRRARAAAVSWRWRRIRT